MCLFFKTVKMHSKTQEYVINCVTVFNQANIYALCLSTKFATNINNIRFRRTFLINNRNLVMNCDFEETSTHS